MIYAKLRSENAVKIAWKYYQNSHSSKLSNPIYDLLEWLKGMYPTQSLGVISCPLVCAKSRKAGKSWVSPSLERLGSRLGCTHTPGIEQLVVPRELGFFE